MRPNKYSDGAERITEKTTTQSNKSGPARWCGVAFDSKYGYPI